MSLQIKQPERWLDKINNAGAVFIGGWTPQTLGDYVIGTNHVLPTYGFSRTQSGLSVSDYLKYINFQRVSIDGLKTIGQHAMILADIEQLDAHKNAVAVRLDTAIKLRGNVLLTSSRGLSAGSRKPAKKLDPADKPRDDGSGETCLNLTAAIRTGVLE